VSITKVTGLEEDMPQAGARFVEPLATAPSLSMLGGKGRSLARLLGAGFPVPDGFHVTTAAYSGFIAENDLASRIIGHAKPEVRRGMLSFDHASEKIRALIVAAPIPDRIATEISAAYAALSAGAVAVRSSATAEDLPDLSFAGQQDTYLNVSGPEELLDAVRRCWASLWTARAIGYRHQLAIAQDDVAMAVVVQRMVQAEISGVLFTANPATGARSEMIVNASYGLGEAIVSGQVTPDAHVVDRTSFTVKESVIGAKQQMVVADGTHGTRVEDVGLARQGVSSLEQAQLDELVRLAVDVEKHFEGEPQDIEWLFAEHKLWLLQSRPITHLPPPPLTDVVWEPPEPGAYLGRSQLVEHIPDPVSTLFEDLHMRRSLQHYWGMNLSARGVHAFEDTQPPACFVVQTTLNGYAYRQVGEPPRTGFLPDEVPHRSVPRPLLRLWWWWRQRTAVMRMWVWWVPEWRYVSLPRYLRVVERWRQLGPATATTEQLWRGIREMSLADARYWYRGGVWNAFSLTRGAEFDLHRFLEQNAPGRFTSGQFLTGQRSRALDGQIALWRIARRIREIPELHTAVVETPPKRLLSLLRTRPDAADVARALDEYLATFGHQISTLDFVEPSEAEAPVNTLQSLHALVLQADYDPVARQYQIAEKRHAAEHEANTFFRSRRLWWQFRWRLWKARHFYPNREEAMFFMGRAWTVLRPLAHELGKRLVAAGTLAQPDDVYFLTTDELARAVRSLVAADTARRRGLGTIDPALPQYRVLVDSRRQLRESRRSLNPPFNVPGLPPWARPRAGAAPDVSQEMSGPNVLKGSPVSPGKVTAVASLILTPADFERMRPGSVLVCPTTTPAWTQLFPQAAGLVTDIGGILAHGSIVAREYGIPAVLGINDATQRIRDGQTITVDGDRGIVVIEEHDTGQGAK
jgi:pyruvate,water dikinase